MKLVSLTQVPDSALPVSQLKAHLRLGTGFSEQTVQDQVLVGFLRAAMAAIEARIGKVLLVQGFEWRVGDWPDTTSKTLPVAPLQGSAMVILEQGTSSESDASDLFTLDDDTHRPILTPCRSFAGQSVTVRFDAGIGMSWDDLPSDLAQGVLLLATHYYEHRDQTGLDDACIPFGVSALIGRYRELRLSKGQAK